MRRMFGERCSSHASATCIGVAPSRPATDRSVAGLQRGEAAEREVGHVGDALRGQGVDQLVVAPVGEVVEVLHADDRRDRLRLGDLLGGHGADAEVPDQSLLLQLGQHARTVRRSSRLGAVHTADAQVDDVERVQAEVARDCRGRPGGSSSGASACSQPPSASRRAPTLVTMRRSSG